MNSAFTNNAISHLSKGYTLYTILRSLFLHFLVKDWNISSSFERLHILSRCSPPCGHMSVVRVLMPSKIVITKLTIICQVCHSCLKCSSKVNYRPQELIKDSSLQYKPTVNNNKFTPNATIQLKMVMLYIMITSLVFSLSYNSARAWNACYSNKTFKNDNKNRKGNLLGTETFFILL